MQNSGLRKSLIGVSLMNSLFMSYKQGELNSSGELVRKRVAKLMRQRSNSNHQLCLDVIKDTDIAWRKTVNHFLKDNMRIEAKSTITAIYNYMAEDIEKYAGITDKHIEMFMIQTVDDLQAEKNSSIVVDYLMKDLGIAKKRSLFAGKLNTIKNNLIIEGKTLASGF